MRVAILDPSVYELLIPGRGMGWRLARANPALAGGISCGISTLARSDARRGPYCRRRTQNLCVWGEVVRVFALSPRFVAHFPLYGDARGSRFCVEIPLS